MAKLRPLPAFLLFFGSMVGLSAPSALWSQDSPPKTAPPSATKSTAAEDPDGKSNDPLRILWLKNPATGALVPVPDLTIDEYEKLDRIKRGLPPVSTAPPNFVITDLHLAAKVNGSSSVCELILEVALRDDRWARIPLGLSKAALRSAPSDQYWLVTPDPASDGFVLWAKGAAGEKKTLQFGFEYPITVSSDASKIQVALPRARSSTATIAIEAGEIISRLEGAGAIDSSKFAGGVTELVCSGFASSLEFSWRPKASPTEKEPWLESVGAVEVHVEGRRQVRADAKFRIRTFGSLPQQLQVRLPVRMRLSPDAVSVSPYVRSQKVSQEETDSAGAIQRVLEFAIDPSAPSDFEMRIQVESDGPIGADTANLTVDGFEFIGAKRHWGNVDLFLTSDWYVAAEQAPVVRRIDVEQGAAVDTTFLHARFEYSTQPSAIQIAARLPRTLVEPSYDIFLTSGQARLEGALRYRFRGPSTGRVEIDLADWDLERIDSPDLAFLVQDAEQVGSRLIIPLSPQQPPPGAESTLRLELRRPLADERAEIRLPRPTANVDASAIVRVSPDVNLEITPRADDFKGVSIDTTSPDSSRDIRDRFAYRTRPGGEQPFLAFDIQIRRQSLLLDLTTQLTMLASRSISVEHKMRLDVAYEPLRELTVELPLAQSAINSARVLLDDLPLDRADEVATEATDKDGVSWTKCRYSLPRAYLGPLTLTVQYPFPNPPPTEGSTNLLVPLPRLSTTGPVQAKPHRLIVRDSSKSVEIESANWSRDVFDSQASAISGEHYFSIKPQTDVLLTIAKTRDPLDRDNRCDRSWLQTTLSETARHDRLCMRMSIWTGPLRVRLPKAVLESSIVVAIDGEEPKFQLTPATAGELAIPPPREDLSKPHVLEIWYQCELNPLRWGSEPLDAPVVSTSLTRERFFWQLLTPPDWYSVSIPTGWTMESEDQFEYWSWSTAPSIDQAELESWTGATLQTAPPVGFNHYLFSAHTLQPTLGLVLAPRRELWLIGLGIVFGLCTLVLYISWMRRPMVLSVLVSAAILIVIFQPHWSTAVTQFLIGGAAVSTSVWLIRSLLGAPRTAIARTSPSRIGARAVETLGLPTDSASAPPRGSSIRGASAAAGPTP